MTKSLKSGRIVPGTGFEMITDTENQTRILSFSILPTEGPQLPTHEEIEPIEVTSSEMHVYNTVWPKYMEILLKTRTSGL